MTPDHDPTEKPSWSVDEPDFNDILAIVARPRPDWMADALCKEHPEINFFPARGEPVEPAKAICARCLVRPECAAYGIEHNERGIWGGLSGQDRRRLRSASAQPGPGPSRPGRAS